MSESEIKTALLFLLQTLENHERRIYDLQLSTRALTETAQAQARNPVAFWEDYSARLARLVRESSDKGVPDFGGYERTRHLLQQAKSSEN
jgi:hypothetical protein